MNDDLKILLESIKKKIASFPQGTHEPNEQTESQNPCSTVENTFVDQQRNSDDESEVSNEPSHENNCADSLFEAFSQEISQLEKNNFFGDDWS